MNSMNSPQSDITKTDKQNKSEKSPAFQFCPKRWFTERSYSDNFRELPKGPGIYAFVEVALVEGAVQRRVLYIGRSKNIKLRIQSHHILPKLICEYGWNDIFIYFLPISRDLQRAEKAFIKSLNPPYNLQHRVRGVE